MYNEFDRFKLIKDIPCASIPIGTVGVVLIVHTDPSIAYIVEFPDGEGGNIGDESFYTITDEFMKKIE